MDQSPAADILLARQPILDANLELFGYELLYRDASGKAEFTNADRATSQVLLNHFTGLVSGVREESQKLAVFVNLDQGMLERGDELPALANQLVLEILETVTPNEKIMTAAAELKQRGFRLALDDFVYAKEWDPLIELVDIIKVDYMLQDKAAIAETRQKLSHYKGLWLAEKVETREDFEHAKSLGFDLFQGYFFAKPIQVSGHKIDASKQLVLNLLAELQDEAVTIDEISAKLSMDPKLPVQLLRIVNSAAFSLQRKIDSLQQAIVMLGLDQLKRWLSLLAMANSDAPLELMRSLLVRARSCEIYAIKNHLDAPGSYFMVGLLSGIDAIIGGKLEDLVDALPLTESVARALKYGEGSRGECLKIFMLFEQADWTSIDLFCPDPMLYNSCYLEALSWTDSLMGELRAVA